MHPRAHNNENQHATNVCKTGNDGERATGHCNGQRWAIQINGHMYLNRIKRVSVCCVRLPTKFNTKKTNELDLIWFVLGVRLVWFCVIHFAISPSAVVNRLLSKKKIEWRFWNNAICQPNGPKKVKHWITCKRQNKNAKELYGSVWGSWDVSLAAAA